MNPHPTQRLSRCPVCGKLTYPRKFPLLVHVEGFGPYVQAKTCKYCSKCRLVMCDQAELENQLAVALQPRRPEVLGNEYLVLGVVNTKTWQAGMRGEATGLVDTLEEHTDFFKKQIDLDLDPGGWRPADADPARYMISHADAVARLETPWRKQPRKRLTPPFFGGGDAYG